MDLSMNDNELRNALKRYGFVPGPISESTRSVYIKKLKKLAAESESQKNSNSQRTHATRNAPTKPVTIEQPSPSPTKRRPVSSSTSGQISGISSGGIPSPATRRRSTERVSVNSPAVLPSPRTNATSLSSQSFRPPQPPFTTPTSGEFQVPTQIPNAHQFSRNVPPQRGAGHTPTRKTHVYFRNGANSESDTDEEFAQSNPCTNTMTRVAGWLRRTSQHSSASQDDRLPFNSNIVRNRFSDLTRVRSDTRDADQIHVSDSDFSDAEGGYGARFQKASSTPYSHSAVRDTATATSTSLLFTPPRLTDHIIKTPPRSGFSVLSDDNDSAQRDSDVIRFRKPSYPYRMHMANRMSRLVPSNMAQVPNLILVSCLTAILILCMSYLFLRDQHGEVGKMADLQKIVCGDNVPLHDVNTADSHSCLRQNDMSEALSLVSIAYDMLSRYAGEYHCGNSVLTSPRMLVKSAYGLVERERLSTDVDSASFMQTWKNALFLVLEVGKPHFHVVAYDALGMELNSKSQVGDIYELESIQPYFPGVCRLRRWFHWLVRLCMTLFWVLLTSASLIGLLLGIRWLRRRRLQALEQKNSRIRDLVAEIVHMLQQQLRENEVNPAQPPYIPIYILRDRLRQQHSDALNLWPDIVRCVYEVETCIGVREWRGVGETWQWQGGTGWQGSALLDKSQRPPFVVPPTECLKIRNMFSTECLDERGKQRIKRELLMKLANCGPIVHIGLDSVGTKGLVYVKCADADTAGRVYHAIHANYFDGRLLTVKFLRDTKYCLRFPEAHGLQQPLSVGNLE